MTEGNRAWEEKMDAMVDRIVQKMEEVLMRMSDDYENNAGGGSTSNYNRQNSTTWLPETVARNEATSLYGGTQPLQNHNGQAAYGSDIHGSTYVENFNYYGQYNEGYNNDGSGLQSDWNQVSQHENGYPPHMVFDPQYDWYYDTIIQEWCTLESYTSSVQHTAQAQDQKYFLIDHYGDQNELRPHLDWKDGRWSTSFQLSKDISIPSSGDGIQEHHTPEGSRGCAVAVAVNNFGDGKGTCEGEVPSSFNSTMSQFDYSSPAFGASASPAFDASATSAFGASSTPSFNFGSSSTPAFGSTSFGMPSTSNPFGSTSSSTMEKTYDNKSEDGQEEEQTVGYLSKVSNKVPGAELKLFLEVEVGMGPISSPSKAKDDLLLFFKLYNPEKEEPRYAGRLFVNSLSKPTDIFTKLNGMAGYTPDEEIELYEEIKFHRNVMWEQFDGGDESGAGKCRGVLLPPPEPPPHRSKGAEPRLAKKGNELGLVRMVFDPGGKFTDHHQSISELQA